METPNTQMQNEIPSTEEIPLDKTNPDSIYNWVARKISGPSFRNIIKDFIDDNCSLFIDIDENTFQQGQIFNEFNQLLENILNDVLEEGGLSQQEFLGAAERGLTDPKYKKYFDQLLNFSDYNFFKRCMTKRNYALIKRFEEQIDQQKKEIEEKKLEEERQKELEKQKELEEQKLREELNINNNEEGKEKTEREKEEEQNKILLYQMLNQEEEKELQEVIKQSLALEEEKRRMAVIEEEELNRALKQSLIESTNPPNKPEEPKKEEKKKLDFQIQKNDNILYQNQPKPIQKEELKQELPPPKKQMAFTTTSNNSFQYSGMIQNNEEKKDTPNNIVSANKGFNLQIQSNNNNFGISSENNIEENKEINIEKKPKREIQYKDNTFEEKKKPEIEKVEIQRKKEEIKERKPIIDYGNNNKGNKKENNLIEKDEENTKDENVNVIVTNEIKIKTNPQPQPQPQIPSEEQKPSDIIKQNNYNETNQTNQIIRENYEEDDNELGGGYDRLLISDDEDEDEKPNLNSNINNNLEQKPLSNAFIDKKNDYNLGKIQIEKNGGNFLNNFSSGSGIKNYQKGGMEKLETKLKKEQFQSVVSKPGEDDDFFAKLKEVEKEKNEKLKEYREQLTKMQKEKRENKAKQTLSKEELAKLQRRELLAEKLKAKRAKENSNK